MEQESEPTVTIAMPPQDDGKDHDPTTIAEAEPAAPSTEVIPEAAPGDAESTALMGVEVPTEVAPELLPLATEETAIAPMTTAEPTQDTPVPVKVEDTVDGAGTQLTGTELSSEKRPLEDNAEGGEASKKLKVEGDDANQELENKVKTEDSVAPERPADGSEPPPIPPSKEGIAVFNDNDVLSGRGGGTNVHPGNRTFRDLINLHRRAYLKARKNDKPAISRAIVRTIRDSNGRFLKKDEKTGLWFEVGDDAAREKTSQALRQRAPEMRKLLFDTEREEARVQAEEHMRNQYMMMGMPPEMIAQMTNMPNMPYPPMPIGPGGAPMFPNPAFFAQMQANGKNGMPAPGTFPPMPGAFPSPGGK